MQDVGNSVVGQNKLKSTINIFLLLNIITTINVYGIEEHNDDVVKSLTFSVGIVKRWSQNLKQQLSNCKKKV